MAWREALSLTVLLDEVNKRWPTRNKDSDGEIGDEAHQERTSDHNAWITDRPGPNVVSAIDITHDPKSGCDSYALAELLKANRDPRIKYLISNRKICSSAVSPWQWRPYYGANPHDHHVHISVLPNKAKYDDTSTWHIAACVLPKTNEPQPASVPPTLRKGASGADVNTLQTKLNSHGATIKVDGQFGPITDSTVRVFQDHSGLPSDGIVGPQTWKALG